MLCYRIYICLFMVIACLSGCVKYTYDKYPEGRYESEIYKENCSFAANFSAQHNLSVLLVDDPTEQQRALYGVLFNSRSTLTMEEGRELITTFLKKYVTLLQSSKAMKEYEKKFGRSARITFDNIGVRIDFWDENMDRISSPFLAQIMVQDGEIYFYESRSKTGELALVQKENVDSAISIPMTVLFPPRIRTFNDTVVEAVSTVSKKMAKNLGIEYGTPTIEYQFNPNSSEHIVISVMPAFYFDGKKIELDDARILAYEFVLEYRKRMAADETVKKLYRELYPRCDMSSDLFPLEHTKLHIGFREGTNSQAYDPPYILTILYSDDIFRYKVYRKRSEKGTSIWNFGFKEIFRETYKEAELFHNSKVNNTHTL